MNTRFKSGAICALTMSCVGFINTHALSQTATVYVNADSEAVSPDGSSWSEAFPFLQDGLTKAGDLLAGDPAPETVEIWVAQGTYRPDQSKDHDWCDDQAEPGPNCCPPYGNCDREATFKLRNRIAIYGGFSGAGWETHIDHAEWENNLTILSGDLEGDDEVLIYNQAGELVLDFDENSYSENSYHVVTAPRGINETATIDGFTIRATIGSAFIAIDARPRVLGCTFISATSAAVHLRGESFIVFDRCYFQSPMREAIRADESATVHCAGE